MDNDSGSNDNDGAAAPAAAPSRGEASAIASLLLQDLRASSPPPAAASSSRILIKLLRNAASGDPRRGTIRLTNPAIQRHVVQVPGALDVLGAAGFGRDGGRGDEYLTFRGGPSSSTSEARERDSPSDGPGSRSLIDALCEGLEALIAESEPPPAAGAAPEAATAASKPTESASKPAPPAEPSSESDFLSERDRLARVAKIKAEKRAQRAQREAAKRRWAEDMEEKKAAARRMEGAALGAVEDSQAHPVVRIGRARGERLPLAKPFEEPPKSVGHGGGGGGDARAVRRRLIQECMKDPSLNAKEKQGKVQELIKMSEGAILAMANAPAATPPAAPATDDTAATATAASPKPDEGTEMATDDGPAKMPAPAVSKEPPGAHEMDVDDAKPAAKPPPELPPSPPPRSDLGKARAPNPPSPEWTRFVERTPRCAGAEGIRDSSVFFGRGGPGSLDAAIPKCLKRLFKELDGLKESLPSDPNCSIWLRFDEETPQYIRALVAAPLPGPTPYSGGLFAFDVYVPNDYPRTNPRVQFLTTGGGRVRFGPNLYACGKVCLSLLGTWPGPKWDPRHSSLYQVLISIQGLLLGVEHPYYLEPGHGGWEGKVKEGDFQVTGQTLAGEVVQEEVGVPLKVILYEDVLRVGTARYAVAQPLKEALDGKRSAAAMGRTGLEAFGDIVRAHFCENRDAVLAEVKNWMSDHALGRDREKALGRAPAGTLPIDALQGLLPKLEALLSKASVPQGEVDAAESTPVAGAVDVKIDADEELKPAAQPPAPLGGDRKLPAKPRVNEIERRPDAAAAKSNEPPSDTDVVEQKRNRMQEAAKDGDFILAGKIQEEVKRLEELQNSMQEAARQGDFIRAGRLQTQFKALTVDHAAVVAKGVATGMAHASQPPSNPGWGDNDWGEGGSGGDEEEMEWSDDGMDEGGPPFGPGVPPHGPPPGPGHFPQGVYPPPGHPAHSKRKWGKHSWGTGQTLAAPPAAGPPASAPSEENAPKKVSAPRKAIPPDQLCRLRVRLPQDTSVVEDFDKKDSLAEVYRRLEGSVLPDRGRAGGEKAAVRGPAVPGGAFSQPLSLAGFTLLLARPKREFSLEMHGARSLAELNLAPSATLTVMRCRERGVVYRGEVESRLRSAQGDAMDVEGLTYEGLMELTERVGKAGPKEGEAFLALTVEEFEASTTKISPSTYLADLDRSSEEHGEEDQRCPICLGCYDGSDDALSLRIVNNCGHTMHTSCLQTWLGTNSSCPLCKMPIINDSKKKNV